MNFKSSSTFNMGISQCGAKGYDMYVMYKMMYSSLKAVFITYGIYYYDLLI